MRYGSLLFGNAANHINNRHYLFGLLLQPHHHFGSFSDPLGKCIHLAYGGANSALHSMRIVGNLLGIACCISGV